MGFGDALQGFGGAVGAVAGDLLTRGNRRRQRELIGRERSLYEQLPTDLDASEEGFYDLGPSAYAGIQEDPAARAQQMRTLAALRSIGEAGGLDPEARADLAEVQAASAGQERAQRGAILDQFSRMGGGNSNRALLAALTAQQGAAQRAGMEGLRVAGDASGRRYRALMDAGSLAGNVRGQDYGIASDRAGAMDRVAAYNAANRQAVAGRNTDRLNRFTEDNADRRYRRAGMVGGTYQDERDFEANRERQIRGLSYGVGSSIGRGAGSTIDYFGGK